MRVKMEKGSTSHIGNSNREEKKPPSCRGSPGHVEAGYRWVVDVDLDKFFERVNHDVLMARRN
jgi:retron-type reverse transcriptase